MGAQDEYVTLVASLPSSERLFRAKQPPLSRLRLDKRLGALSPEHAATLAVIEEALSWGAYAMSVSGAQAVARLERALAVVPQPTLRLILRERFELRVAVAALRRRAAGDGPQSAAADWGVWGRRLAENWSEPTFKLDRRHPWLARANLLVSEGDPKGLERHILEVTFRHLQRRAAFHHFDFEAVVIYVLKWSIFDRWARLNAEAAQRRVEALADAALADFPDPEFDGGADAVAV